LSSLSVTEPIVTAVQRTRHILFQPFNLPKWLRLGFCAFLAGMGQAGGTRGGTGGDGSGSDPELGTFDLDGVGAWVQENLPLIITVTSLVLVLLIVLGILFTWLGSRGRFMLLDGVIRNRGAIAEPWREYRREGNSLFRFRFYLGLLFLGLITMILTLSLLLAWPDLESNQLSGSGVMAIVIGGLLLLILIVSLSVISLLLNDFVVPIMYLRRIPVQAAWSEFRISFWQNNQGAVVLYFLMRFVLNLAVGILSVVAIMLSCLIALVPYVGSVLLLPLTVFQVSYPLGFIEQFGPQWQVFATDPEASQPS
jgi:hypothetical protein